MKIKAKDEKRVVKLARRAVRRRIESWQAESEIEEITGDGSGALAELLDELGATWDENDEPTDEQLLKYLRGRA